MLEGTLDAAMGSYTAAQSVLQSDRGTVFAVHSKKVDAIPAIKPARTGRDVEILHRQRLLRLGRAQSDAAAGRRSPRGALRRRQQRSQGEGCSQRCSVLEPAIGFKETNALIERDCRSG